MNLMQKRPKVAELKMIFPLGCHLPATNGIWQLREWLPFMTFGLEEG